MEVKKVLGSIMSTAEDHRSINVPKVFVVCDQHDTAAVWGYMLREKGLTVILETSLKHALDRWAQEKPDLVIIDVDSENQDPLEIYQKFRAATMGPILLFFPTHHEKRILQAYAGGVDEVVVKPISPAIFLAKIMAWVRWSWTIPMDKLNLVRVGKHNLDPKRRCLTDSVGTEIKLTNLEFQLLHLLMSCPGYIFDVEDIIVSIWGKYGSGDQILLKNLVYRLRKKIEKDPSHPVFLQTWPGGYSFQD
jgi:DNA-binding response OmpR family regulator